MACIDQSNIINTESRHIYWKYSVIAWQIVTSTGSNLQTPHHQTYSNKLTKSKYNTQNNISKLGKITGLLLYCGQINDHDDDERLGLRTKFLLSCFYTLTYWFKTCNPK